MLTKKIKTKLITLCVLVLLTGAIYVITEYTSVQNSPSSTQLIVTNKDSLPVSAWLTLGGVPSADTAQWVQNVENIFGITNSGLAGMFVLGPGDSLFYTPSKAIQGNLSFITSPYQCADSVNTGSNIVEFCLNNFGTVVNAQETVEISCVPGVTFIASVDFYNGGVWTANNPGYDTITHIQNNVFGHNTGLPGVYPVGCDDCTKQTNQAPPCTIGKNEAPQKLPICNIQRNADQSGGSIVISYLGPAYQICK